MFCDLICSCSLNELACILFRYWKMFRCHHVLILILVCRVNKILYSANKVLFRQRTDIRHVQFVSPL